MGTTLGESFPDLAKKMNPAYRRVTLEQMLAHRAGFSDQSRPDGKTFLDMHHLPGTPREQRQAYVAMILAEPQVNELGTEYLYSEPELCRSRRYCREDYNESWEELMQKRIFEPLGMKTCGFGAMERREKSISHGNIK